MIGTPVSFTLWQVDYRHKRPEVSTAEKQTFVEGKVFFSTADPTGADILQVAARIVLGRDAEAGHEFSLTHVHRVLDAKGLALVARDQASLPFDASSAVWLENARLRADLGTAQMRIAELERQQAVNAPATSRDATA